MSRSASEVSIITVNWNGQKHLSQLLPSLLPLGAREIIVVDNGSEDGSVSYLESEFPEVLIIRNEVNRGFAHPNNLAARESGGSILAFINNDMRADAKWLEAALRRMEEYPCVGSRILDWEGEKADFNGSSLQYLGYAMQQDAGKLVNQLTNRQEILFPCGGAMLIERQLFLQLGGFDEDYFAVYEDVDLGWRLWLSGSKVALASDSITYHRAHSTLASKGSAKMRYLMHRNALLTIIKNYEEDTVRRLLPLALILAVKRAVRCSGVSKESFYLWSEVENRLEQGDRTAQTELLDSLNHLVAVEDVLQSLPETLAKRKLVQESRKMTDQELLALFQDPLRPIVEDSEYIADEIEHLKAMKLEGLFDLADYEGLTEALPEKLHIKTARLKRELKGLQWLSGQATGHPPKPRGGRLGSFLDLWSDVGLRSALGYSLKKWRRGF